MPLAQPGKKILWFDVETGGIDHKTDALLQLSALVEVDGEVVDEINLKMRPVVGKKVTSESRATHGLTAEVINSFDQPERAYCEFIDFLSKHGRKSDKAGRFIMAGYNADFDCRFLSEWFQDMSGGLYAYWDFLQFSPIDILPTLRTLRHAGAIDIPDTKLETCCKYFGIPIKAHDALSDIKATRDLTHIVVERILDGWSKGGEW